MKRFLALAFVLMLTFVLACPVFATDFVPSISYKDSPELVAGDDGNYGTATDGDGNNLHTVEHDCLVVTPIALVDESELIPEDAAEELKAVYAFLKDTPDYFGDDVVVRELFDVSILCEELNNALAPEGNTMDLTFNIGIAADEEIWAKVKVDGEWIDVPVVNNGDGTVTCTFEAVCPVVFLTGKVVAPPAQTGDTTNLVLYGVLMAVSLIAIVALVVVYCRRTNRQ